MTYYKKPEDRASEHVGLRLTLAEKEAAERIAGQEGKSLTALFRDLLAERIVREKRSRRRKKGGA